MSDSLRLIELLTEALKREAAERERANKAEAALRELQPIYRPPSDGIPPPKERELPYYYDAGVYARDASDARWNYFKPGCRVRVTKRWRWGGKSQYDIGDTGTIVRVDKDNYEHCGFVARVKFDPSPTVLVSVDTTYEIDPEDLELIP